MIKQLFISTSSSSPVHGGPWFIFSPEFIHLKDVSVSRLLEGTFLGWTVRLLWCRPEVWRQRLCFSTCDIQAENPGTSSYVSQKTGPEFIENKKEGSQFLGFDSTSCESGRLPGRVIIGLKPLTSSLSTVNTTRLINPLRMSLNKNSRYV